MIDGFSSSVPRVLLALLPRDLRAPVAGDLFEEFDGVRVRRGRALAAVWLWWHAARLAVTFGWERIVHGRPLPPVGDKDTWGRAMGDSLRQDLVFGIRQLRRQPGFTVVAVLALALGVGANTAIFSVVDAVLWRALPYPQAERIVSIAEQRPREQRGFGPVAPADFFDWRSDSRSFSAMAAYYEFALNLTGGGEPERLRVLAVSPGFLEALGLAPARGRDFRPDEEAVGRDRVVILTDQLWRRRFGARADVEGGTVALDGERYEVVGILPSEFWWPTSPGLLVPLALTDHDRGLRAAHFLDVVGRLRRGVSLEQAGEELNLIGRRLSAAYPNENANHGPNARSLRDALVGNRRTALLVLLAAVGLVTLIACANVATLLLARASTRQREFAIRTAVGAARTRLFRQLLTESVLLALAGGGAGVSLAAGLLSAFRIVLPPQFSALPGLDRVGIDGRVLAAALGLAILTGLIFGLVPAFLASGQRPGARLGEDGRNSGASARSGRMRSALVVAELALSLVLLVAAALLIVSFERLISVSPGFRTDRLETTTLNLPASRYAVRPRVLAFQRALFDRLRGAPGVDAVAATTALPFTGSDERLDLALERGNPQLGAPVRIHPRLVTPGYFTTMSIPLLRGRPFTEHDDESGRDVVIINEAAARRFWPADDPIGQRISIGGRTRWREIVGVVGDVRHQGLDADPNPEAYMPYAQTFTELGNLWHLTMTVVIRTAADPPAAASMLRTAVSGVDPQQPVGLVRPIEDLIAESIAPRRLILLLLSSFAVVALLLTASGLYGVVSYLVTQRTREIGVRMALGAPPSSVLRMVLSQAGVLTLAGIGAGTAGSLVLTRFLSALLFGVAAADPGVYLAGALLLALVALGAVVVPSVRATRVDPLTALREP